jgi:predicted site-specific integrase-resolvase
MPENIPQLLTLLAVARALCVSPHTVRAWVRKGRLRPIRLCRRLLFHPDEITRFLGEASLNDAGATVCR